ncbi:HNH endonuclease domain-containing protein [Planktothrix agardhii]|jgi:hypothetical protein|uniref:HNH endonuclease domain-containing protein n=1 Tax=Planktothrix agardhii TaxID=1160 RepID=UPI002B1FFAFA|nr:HNH endonuclease domain-containing protein [Planktothrix agardhii]MEA5561301.1 HNH endonuclease domain-containing protein [Planktothrix agardhii UHCC 0887]
MYSLPSSNSLNISALSGLFNATTNSYKYLYFLSLLDILRRRKFETSSSITFREIIVEMLANAWYPHTYSKLSFGTQDKITQKLDSLNLEISDPILKFTDTDKKLLLKTISSQKINDIISYFKKYVPFRLLCPFLEQELKEENISRGIGNDLDLAMPNIVQKYFESKKPLYYFNSTEYKNCNSLIFSSEWAEYLQENYPIVRGWVSWEFLKYMQQKNPNVPNIVNKLFMPQQRDSLSNQTKYWKIILTHKEIQCIYSKVKLNKDNISLDHYLPWSFVAHDQLWNLIPTTQSVNSSKSNNLPSTNQYFENFIKLQHLGLTVSCQYFKQNSKQKTWEKYTEPFISELKISNTDDLLDLEKLTNAYKITLNPLIALAKNQGFSSNWVYS